jgi:hypothetical protein
MLSVNIGAPDTVTASLMWSVTAMVVSPLTAPFTGEALRPVTMATAAIFKLRKLTAMLSLADER